MSAGRLHGDDVYKALKGAFRKGVKDAGGLESFAAITRVDHARLGKYGRPHEAMHAPLDAVADLEKDLGAPVVTTVLADIAGYVLVPKPPVHGGLAWMGHLTSLAKEAGEAMAVLGDAIGSDGVVTADEIRDMGLRREIREAMEALARIDQALSIVLAEDDG